ncbi:MAG: FAD:protein FMN transferase [Candidatus Palauibacterales bacterium]|nr:FAD:protein FMN transferase [Candidatus Palauibacterales bacterium]MDP2582758.1 FAD:protein FMN transferase [Candidatus Palauibacterales bacterium]
MNDIDRGSGERGSPDGVIQPAPTGRSLSRRRFVAVGAGIFVVSALPAVALRRSRRLYRRTIPVMGTLAEVGVVDDDAERAEAAIGAALAELRWVDRTMSRFSRASDVGRANAAAVGARTPVRAETARVVAEGLRWARASGDRFDPGLARALALWDVDHRHSPPASDAVAAFAGQALYRELEVERPRGDVGRGDRPGYIVRRHPEVGVDLGGIAKGHAVDRAVAALRRHGARDGMVNAGGDLYALGLSPEGSPWRVGIRSPSDPTRLLGQLDVTDRAVATSGDYEQYFDYRGRRYGHILDPATAAPWQTTVHSVTVMADDCMAADAGATAVFGASESDSAAILGRVAPGASRV